MRFVGDKDWRTVIGIVGDVRAYDLQQSEPEWMKGTAYVPYTATATVEGGRMPAEMTIVARSTLNLSNAASTLRNTLAHLRVSGREFPLGNKDAMSCPSALVRQRDRHLCFIRGK